MNFFIWEKKDVPTLLRFRKRLAWAFIYNDFLEGETGEVEKRTRNRAVGHYLETAPLHARAFFGRKWDVTAEKKYQQYTCRGLNCLKNT
mmetsp:Transcript_20144/g.20429  ORF Transcript_20144/g.20429 Transcript_20144/m.20429 type:complete len:89 (-) Transcript_20144:107-373(-)